MKKNLLLLIVCVFVVLGIQAQTEIDSTKSQDTSKFEMPFQLTFFYPLGTKGTNAYKEPNVLSLNLVAGVSSGLNGVELGGVVNVTNGDMSGFQLAGFSNLVDGKTYGTQIAGFSNINGSTVTGGQLAGFTNIAADSVRGLQMAGFYNQSNNYLRGAQLAGFANNTIGDVHGQQASGFINIASGSVNGLQAAGYSNLCGDSLKGIQMSAFLNVAKSVEGFQLGLINISDTVISGAPIGFLSIVKNGFKRFELEVNDYYYISANIKTGHQSFYNIFSAHVRPEKEDLVWGLGYGIGSGLKNTDKFGLNLDLSLSHINYGQAFKVNINELTQLKLQASYSFAKRFAIYGGPVLKVLVRDSDVESIFSNPLYSWQDGNYFTEMALGFSAGLRF